VNADDRRLLERWLQLIVRLRRRGALDPAEEADLVARAVEAVSS
jgi:hypothetical protein